MDIIIVLPFFCRLPFARYQDAADGAHEQQDAERLERQQVFVLVRPHEGLPDRLHIGLVVAQHRGIAPVEETVLQRHPGGDEQSGEGRDGTGKHPAPVVRFGPVAFGTRQQDGENEEDENTARIDRKLHDRQKVVIQHEIKPCGAYQHEKQIGRRTEYLARGDRQHRRYDYRRGQQIENDYVSYPFHDLFRF